ncbi:hypothetical protein JCM10908_007067 [Rhodotorula pacifica]|uniref:uncharacterized protein n=1 Tax=Rhodotorula pacifica TaxID=1495444 RepID=UPI003173F4C4
MGNASETPGLHKRSFSAVRISIDRLLDDDELAPLRHDSVTHGTPLLPEKDARYLLGNDSRTATRPQDGLAWRKPRPSRIGAYLRSGFILVASATVVGVVIYALTATRGSYLSKSIAHAGSWRTYMTTGETTSTELRVDHTYAYATPLPNDANAYEEHPIHGLIREAKLQWRAKIDRQSKTYDEAVREYKRRYRRNPPPGFDYWYRWATEKNVQLIDEFDTISDQIEPFLAIRPSVLQQRMAEHRNLDGRGRNYGIIDIADGRVAVSGAKWRPAVPDGFVDLVAPVAHLLPDLVVPLYLHDGPSTAHTADAMAAYRRAAREERFVDEETMPLAGDATRSKAAWQCDVDSPFRHSIEGVDGPRPPGPAFIHQHSNAMTYCMNPQNFLLHGATAVGPSLNSLQPSFSLSRHFWTGDLVWPSTILYDLNPKNESTFRDKGHKLLWRGTPDGVGVETGSPWRRSHRFRLIALTNSNSSRVRTIRETRRNSFGQEYQVDVERSFQELNQRYSNVRPTGVPVQCEPELCEEITRTLPFSEKISLEEMADNRYVMDVDGNAYSARFRAHLASNQVPFKSTVFPEWYDGRIQPWVHYVPARVDYADLYNLLAFFDGSTDSARSGHHDMLAEEIATAGADWARNFWRTEDMQAYVFRLLLEWARVMDPERERQ